MHLVQLHKANDNAPTEDGVYSTSNCEADYISPNPYLTYGLILCNAWNETTRRLLIFKKNAEEIVIRPLQNERFMLYHSYIWYDYDSQHQIISLEYSENTDFFVNFYNITPLYVIFNVPHEVSTSSNPLVSLLRYIKEKTLYIGLIGHDTPKYSIVFDDSCRYYYYNFANSEAIFVTKNPFQFYIILDRYYNLFYILIAMEPRLLEEFNDYNITVSNYDPGNDPSLRVDDIINHYFDIHNKTGLSHNDDINNATDSFSYSLIRVLLGSIKNDLAQMYYFRLQTDIGWPGQAGFNYRPLAETPLCIYFPLFRPQLNNNGFSTPWPQFAPNDASTYVHRFYLEIMLHNNGAVHSFRLSMDYGSSLSYPTFFCDISVPDLVPPWRVDSCDFTRPFRFVGDAGCDSADEWNNDTRNANYLFRIVKGSSTSYVIKGIGCDELTTEISSFSDFSANNTFGIRMYVTGIDVMQRITFSESGYPIDAISNALANSDTINSGTCFVLFDESLVENAADFTSIYQAVTSALPNSIVCYIGSSETVPDSHRNKVIHSDAIVTNLDTNEQMPLVIKYIRYAKRLHELFNG
jgi:hypothetical protein